MHLAAQLVNQRSVQHGPLVLVSEPRKFHTPTIDRDRTVSRRSASFNKYSAESLNELEKELAALRAENRKLQRALQEESLRHEACEELINLAESTYHIKVRKNSDAK